jgi:hypothetical protein
MAETKTIIIDLQLDSSEVKSEFKVVDKQLDETKDRVKKLKTETDKTSQSMSSGFKAGSDAAALIPGPIGQAATAVSGLKAAFDAVKVSLVGVRIALVATGIGAFVVIVGTLVAYFMNTEKGAQSLRVAMAGLGAVVSNLIDGWLGFVKAIGSFLTLDFKGGIANIKQSFDSFTTGLVDNTAAAIKNAKALNDVEVAEGDLTVARAKANMEITKARLIADDLNKSTEERIEAVKRAAEFEEKVAAQELKIAQQKANALAEGVRRKVDADEKERDIADEALVRVYELQSETLKREKRLGSEIQSLRNEQAGKDKERDATAADEKNKRLAEQKERNAEEAKAAKELADEKIRIAKELQDEEDRLATERSRRFDEVRKAEKETKDWFDEQNAKTQEEKDALEIERALKAAQDKHKAVEDAIFSLNLTSEEKIALWKEAKDLADKEKFEITTAMLIEDEQKRAEALQAIKDKAADTEKKAEEKKLADLAKLNAARISAATNVAGALGAIGRLMQQQGQENTAAAKTLAVAEIAISTAVAIAGAIKTASTGSVTAWDMIAGIAAGIAAVVAGIASATAILDTADVPGPSAAGAMSSVAASAPTITPVTTNTTQLGNTQQAELQPVQAYVVETQITGSQTNINQIESQSTFGGG